MDIVPIAYILLILEVKDEQNISNRALGACGLKHMHEITEHDCCFQA